MIPDLKGARAIEHTDKRILNANKGIGNYIPKEDMFDFIQSTFHKVAQHLVAHCGPLSRYALVVSPSGGKYDTNVFTKDGKNIINSIEFSSPIEEILKEMLIYVASRVDSKAGDGTTSSMILTARFFEHVASYYKDKPVNTTKFNKSYKRFHKSMMGYLDDQKVTIDELVEKVRGKSLNDISLHEYQMVVAAFAACQALTSSGGDMELAQAMFDIYYQSPKCTWDYTDVYHQKIESDKSFLVDVHDHDYVLNKCNISNTSMLNHNLGTEFKNEHCDVLVLPEAIDDGGVDTDMLLSFLKEVVADEYRKHDLFIISPRIGGAINYIVSEHNSKSTNFKIITCEFHERTIPSSVAWELLGLSYCSGSLPYLPSQGYGYLTEAYLLTDISVEYRYNRCFFNGIFQHASRVTGVAITEDPVKHPFFEYEDESIFPAYFDFLRQLRQQIDGWKTDINQDRYYHTIESVKQLISTMTTPRRPRLVVGGSSHDHMTAIDVIRDVCGAINSSLTNGFVVGSSFALMRALKAHTEHSDHRVEELRHTEGDEFFDFLTAACDDLIYITTHGTAPASFTNDKSVSSSRAFYPHVENSKYKYLNLKETDNIPRDITHVISKMTTYLTGEINTNEVRLDEDILTNDYPIVQPSPVFEQLLERIGDLMIKLITTDSIIVPGAVYIKEQSVAYGVAVSNGALPTGSGTPVPLTNHITS